MRWHTLWLKAVDQLRMLLPLAVVALLAAYTWWLVQSMPKPAETAPTVLPERTADYVLHRARIDRFDGQGTRVAWLEGQAMTHFLKDDRLLIDDLHLYSEDPQSPGAWLEAWARQGQYLGNSQVVELQGQAKVVAVPAATQDEPRGKTTFMGEQLRWDAQQQLLTTDRPVQLQSPQGDVRADQLRHEVATGMSTLSGRVSGAFLPRAIPRAPAQAESEKGT